MKMKEGVYKIINACMYIYILYNYCSLSRIPVSLYLREKSIYLYVLFYNNLCKKIIN